MPLPIEPVLWPILSFVDDLIHDYCDLTQEAIILNVIENNQLFFVIYCYLEVLDHPPIHPSKLSTSCEPLSDNEEPLF